MTQNTYSTQSRKNKIELQDYDFAKDLHNRLLLSKLTVFEVEVLREIVFNSLEFPIEELSETLEVPIGQILEVLYALEPTKLFTQYRETLVVDKEARKYYEIQISKFGSENKLGIDHFLHLLTQIPIHHLPGWFNLSKTSDDIFESIIEKNLLTPKIYEKYLTELQYNDEYSASIVEDLFKSENFQLEVDSIAEKYDLSREKLEEIIILLEFNNVCYLQYIENGDHWKAILTPLEEWKTHLDLIKKTTCHPVVSLEEIAREHSHDFGFIEDIDTIIDQISQASTPPRIRVAGKSYRIDSISAVGSFPEVYMERMIEKIIELRLAAIEDEKIRITENAAQWLSSSIQEKAMVLYFSTINRYRKQQQGVAFTDRDIRELEKSLKRILKSGWVYIDDFIKGLTVPLSTTCEVTLTKKGRRYFYSRPVYGEAEIAFIHEVLNHHLFESGMIALGRCGGRSCFMVTPFGRLSLGE